MVLEASCVPQIDQSDYESNKVGLDERINSITQFASKPFYNKLLKRLAKQNPANASTICDYIDAERTEINIKQSTSEGKIKVIAWLSMFHQVKIFKEMTKEDILNYLNRIRKSISDDPMQRWIGSYNGRQMILNKFFKWLYDPSEPNQKNRKSPTCMIGIKKLPNKIKSPYRHTDIWYPKEHAVFLKYCPDKRDRCYHAMANDTSARPHEILNLRISDIKFSITDDGIQYAEVLINEGKTGPRTVPLIDSIPFLKEWIAEHPSGTNNSSWLFISKGHNNFGQKLTYDGIVDRYSYYYKIRFFPRLLEDKTVPEEDKEIIRSMLTKPWNLYIFRHSALTDKNQILPEAILRSHAGWTMSSKRPQVYIHLSGESSRILLEKRGILSKTDKEISNVLKSRTCPNCLEGNKPGSKFCIKCKMILSFDNYRQTIDKLKEKEDRFEIMEKRIEMISLQMGKIINGMSNLDQSSKNRLTKDLFQSGFLVSEEKKSVDITKCDST